MTAEQGQGAQPPPAAGSPAKQEDRPQVSIDAVMNLDLRVGTILEAREHPAADKLLILTVDIGEAQPRTLVAGIKAAYAPEELKGKQVVVVANLKPATLRGVESQGMVLAGSDANGISILSPLRPLTPGSRVK